jgi:hypothetical protein
MIKELIQTGKSTIQYMIVLLLLYIANMPRSLSIPFFILATVGYVLSVLPEGGEK